jgi:undecaprenyl-diphosphatase
MSWLQQIDSLLFLHINHFAGRSAMLDRIAFDISDSTILKGGLFVAFYWWMWFDDRHPDRPGRRRDVAVSLMCGVIAAIVSRGLQVGLPFHQRPLHTPDLAMRLPLGIDPETLSSFSSFPSDHAVLFCALCVPIWRRSHLLGTVAALWTLLVICLPHVYLGYHWPSDVIAGAFIGSSLMPLLCLAIRSTRFPDRLLRLEADHPAVFYAVSWLLALELAVMFYDVRHFLLDAVNLARILVA